MVFEIYIIHLSLSESRIYNRACRELCFRFARIQNVISIRVDSALKRWMRVVWVLRWPGAICIQTDSDAQNDECEMTEIRMNSVWGNKFFFVSEIIWQNVHAHLITIKSLFTSHVQCSLFIHMFHSSVSSSNSTIKRCAARALGTGYIWLSMQTNKIKKCTHIQHPQRQQHPVITQQHPNRAM